MVDRVAAFTDTYLPTVNGVSYTLHTWATRFSAAGGRMEVVFPESDHDPAPHEFPVGSLPFPFYDGVRLGQPRVPEDLSSAAVVHAHTPFALGLAARRYARSLGVPLVASYHTPAAEYARYLAPGIGTALVGRLASGYERWFYDGADLVIAPSATAREHVRDDLGVSTPVTVVSNGVDLECFDPERGDSAAFRARQDLSPDGHLIGYTGRHGHEKRLEELIDAAAILDTRLTDSLTLVVAGDGPARQKLMARAEVKGLDARFPGFLDRQTLPDLYATLDVFGFPSPVETQGLVALEAIASGTPVVAADEGALAETVTGRTGRHYPSGDVEAFADALEAALLERERLAARCCRRRSELSVERSLERLRSIYAATVERG